MLTIRDLTVYASFSNAPLKEIFGWEGADNFRSFKVECSFEDRIFLFKKNAIIQKHRNKVHSTLKTITGLF